jgi:peptide/nickel transport system substrate-binding protein
MSEQIPAADNFWIGTNLSGFASPAYDAACARARSSLADETAYWQAHREVQAILAAELPSLPLYQRLKIAAAGPGLCGLEFDPAGWRELRTIEAWEFTGESCLP